MYKALDTRSETEIVILSRAWARRLDELRQMDRRDWLVCQGCRQPVRVRAGRFRRAHFAHKHLKGCSYGAESPALLEARAVLYGWLAGQFPDGLTVEKQIEGTALLRPVDCWVEKDGICLAYWIVADRMKLDARETLRSSLALDGVAVTWVLDSALLNPDPQRLEAIRLSPTERDFLQESAYDSTGDDLQTGQSLHFLDAQAGQWITYRSLHLVHRPNIFAGRCLSHPLAEVTAHPLTGEPVHPGEEERLSRVRRAQTEREAAIRKAEARYQRWMEAHAAGKIPHPAPAPAERPRSALGLGTPETYPCTFCGTLTEDWWTTFLDHGVRKCKCRACLAKGLG